MDGDVGLSERRGEATDATATYVGDEGRGELPGPHGVPIDPLEPWVRTDGGRVRETFLRVAGDKGTDKRVAISRQPRGELELAFQNALMQLLARGFTAFAQGGEGRLADETVKEKYAKCPIVRRFAGVCFTRERLRGHVVLGPAPRMLLVGKTAQVLGEAKVGENKVAFAIEKQVLRFDIAVNNIHVVECFKGEKKLGGVKFGGRFAKHGLVAEVVHEFPAGREIHNEIDALGCLKGNVEAYNERRVVSEV